MEEEDLQTKFEEEIKTLRQNYGGENLLDTEYNPAQEIEQVLETSISEKSTSYISELFEKLPRSVMILQIISQITRELS